MDQFSVSETLSEIEASLERLMTIASLDEIIVLLKQMFVLAARAASDSVDDTERAVLQEELVALREKIDLIADQMDNNGSIQGS